MSHDADTVPGRLAGHALRNANLRKRSLARAEEAAPLARVLVVLRAQVLGMTRLEFARKSGISRGTLRDLELGIHIPVRRTLQRFISFCKDGGAASEHLEEVYRLYAGPADALGPLIARLELRAGSSAELARRVGISPATLWEYRRGNFPLPVAMLRRLCQAVEVDPTVAESIWEETERQRFLQRGYPPALAAFWTLCARKGYAEKHLLSLGLRTNALRRLRYLEMPAWKEIAKVARTLGRSEQELQKLERLWRHEEQSRNGRLSDAFGSRLQQLRKKKGLRRREVADLFHVGGKKPARVIKSIEEDGCYSARAYPAGLAALLAGKTEEQEQLLRLWEHRRKQFHLRHRPETRIELRLARERYGFEHADMEPILGYAALEYQRIERGTCPLPDSARQRIEQAIHRAGQCRVESMLREKDTRDAARAEWRSPPSVGAMVSRLADREGGIIPLHRHLRRAKVLGFWAGRLRAIARGEEVPPWPLVERIGLACGVSDLSAAKADWQEQYRKRLEVSPRSPLGTEVRLLIAEMAATVREFSKRLGFSPSVLVRDLQRMDDDRPVKWFHVERILQAAGVQINSRRWQQIHAWWYASWGER